ncbi:MAG: hypothetical protein ABWW65_04395 [Thermoprotei archaeon]
MTVFVKLLLDSIMEFIKRDYEEEDVRIEVIGSSVSVPLHEGFTEITRGAEYIVPRWLAKILEKKGIARIKTEEISIERLSSIAYNEESLVQKLQLTKLPRYFYVDNSLLLRELKNKVRETTELSLLEEYKQREDLFLTIARLRLRKMLNFILLPAVPQEIIEKLSEEEKLLLHVLRGIIESWTKSLGIEKS